jgi:aspartate-semialdehyde dehydrogenase
MQELTKEDKIIAKPNCSTIQMVIWHPLHKKYNIKRYCFNLPIHHWNGSKGVQQLENEYAGVKGEMALQISNSQKCDSTM